MTTVKLFSHSITLAAWTACYAAGVQGSLSIGAGLAALTVTTVISTREQRRIWRKARD